MCLFTLEQSLAPELHSTSGTPVALLGLSHDLQAQEKSGHFLKTWEQSVGYDELINPVMLKGSLRLAGPATKTTSMGGAQSFIDVQLREAEINLKEMSAMMWIKCKDTTGTITLLVNMKHQI